MAIVLDQAKLATSDTGYSQAIEMGENNALAVGVTLIVGTAAPAVTVEGSNDLSNWAVGGISGSITVATAPSYQAATFSLIATRYARIKVAPSTAALIITVSANPQRL